MTTTTLAATAVGVASHRGRGEEVGMHTEQGTVDEPRPLMEIIGDMDRLSDEYRASLARQRQTNADNRRVSGLDAYPDEWVDRIGHAALRHTDDGSPSMLPLAVIGQGEYAREVHG